MAGKKLMTAYYELIAATPNAEAQITSAIVPAASKAGAKGGASAGSSIGSNLIAGLKKFAAPIAAAMSVAAVKKFASDSVSQFTSMAASTSGLQRIIGGTTSQVSSLQGAMRLSGMDANAAGGSLTIFAKKLQGVQGDSKKTAAMQQLLGTSINGANGQMKPMSELLPQVADKFKNMPDGVQKTALATQLFGKSGTQMLPFLNKGSAGIAELEGKAKSLGLVLDDQSKAKFAAYKSATRNLQTSMDGLKTQVGQALIPVFTGFSNLIDNAIIPAIHGLLTWFQNPAVQNFAAQAGAALEQLGTQIGSIVATMMQKLGSLLQWVTRNKDWLSAIAAGIGTVIAAFQAWKIAQDLWSAATRIATAVQTAFNVVMDANPITIVIVALAALVAGLVYFFTQTDTGRKIWSEFIAWLKAAWTDVQNFFSNLWQSISGGVTSAWNGIGGFLSNLWKSIASNTSSTWNGIRDFFSDLWNGIKATFSNAANGARSTWDSTANWFGSVPGRIAGVFSGIGGAIAGYFWNAVSGVENAWNSAVGWMYGIPGRILNALGNVGQLLWGAGWNIITGFLNGLISAWNQVTDFIGGIAGWIRDHKGPLSYDATLLVPAGDVIMAGFGGSLRKSWKANVMPFVAGLNDDLQSMVADPTLSLDAKTQGSAGYGGNTYVTQTVNNPVAAPWPIKSADDSDHTFNS
ncbi:MAG: hypothetical protein LKI34_02815 [Bifidobacterium tibiigranuli]|jgi:phage-related protein|uniref:phage tail protein n=1 Tax=Bifidobacterium tibiigranuli TaxID=2172043 RepID=UPI0026F08B14|nr:phage tail tape measure protein [Bifidobacterium tibiigranuli]MCI1673138.1 hypothetical protein [Bifidobacterium tibiigranuli]MCI1713617.1 hypothetical protein [Bifidobacterium tibiigranuli]